MLLLILCHGPCLGSIESKAVCTTPHGQTQVSGQACGLSTGAGNALSTAAIAHISEERQAVPHSTADAKRLFTLSYR